ncbi:MAG: hypothetical protein SynsKO_21050 [Synoicihabitans sp.]
MNYPHFVGIEQEGANGELLHFVVHTRDPKMAVKFSAERINGKVEPGTIRHLAVPNSWAGQYSQYGKLLAKAEAFFRATLRGEEPAPNRLKSLGPS